MVGGRVAIAWPAAFHNLAVAGADRIDEDEVGEVEPGFGVRQEGRHGRRRRGLDIHRQAPWPKPPEMQPDRGRARTAIERERDGPLPWICAIERIGDVGHFGERAALRIGNWQRARGCREGKRTAGQFDHMLGNRVRGQPAGALIALPDLVRLLRGGGRPRADVVGGCRRQ
jgi:hypothetical protein